MKKSRKGLKITLGIIAALLALVLLAVGGYLLWWQGQVRGGRGGAYTLPEGFTVTAHAGALDTEDNSPESVEAALAFFEQAGVKGVIEVDVRFAPDGTPLLAHDAVESAEGHLLLADFFAMTRESDVGFNLDLKEYANLPEVARLAEQYGVYARCFYTGVGEDAVPTVRAEGGGIPYYLNCYPNPLLLGSKNYAASLAEKVAGLGAIGVNCHFRFASTTLREGLHEKGLLLSLWTVSTETDLYAALHFAPDNITSRQPGLLVALLAKQG